MRSFWKNAGPTQLSDQFAKMSPNLERALLLFQQSRHDLAEGELRQALVGGVKPIEVKVPERGKVMKLSAALPPSLVTVTLEVKAPKN